MLLRSLAVLCGNIPQSWGPSALAFCILKVETNYSMKPCLPACQKLLWGQGRGSPSHISTCCPGAEHPQPQCFWRWVATGWLWESRNGCGRPLGTESQHRGLHAPATDVLSTMQHNSKCFSLQHSFNLLANTLAREKLTQTVKAQDAEGRVGKRCEKTSLCAVPGWSISYCSRITVNRPLHEALA